MLLCISLLIVDIVSAQSTGTITYNSVTGTNVISRQNNLNNIIVVCSHKNGIEAEFTVSNKNLKTTIGPYTGLTGDERDGYIVESMEVVDSICYFCGKKWHEQLVPIYTMEGYISYEPEYSYKGFIGKFNINDILSGGTSFKEMSFNNISELSKLTYSGGNITAIGENTNNISIVLELRQQLGWWFYRIGTSPRSDEVFMDIVSCNSETVMATRFDGSLSSTMLERNIGLRYGSKSNYCGSCTYLYCYDVCDIFTSNGLKSYYVSPVLLSWNHVGNTVFVSSLGQQYHWANRPYMFRVNRKGEDTIRYQFTSDSYRYSKINEVRFRNAPNPNNQMVLLMESTSGKSTFRFPQWNSPVGTVSDTIVDDDTLKFQSIHPFYNSIYLSLLAGGFNANTGKVLTYKLYGIHNPYNNWSDNTCRSVKTGTIIKDYKPAPPTQSYSPLGTTNYVRKDFSTVSFQVQVTGTTTGC